MKPNTKITEKSLKRKSLTYSIWDGAAYAWMFGIGETYFPAFAVFLKASNLQIGLITSIPQLIASVCQFLMIIILKISRQRKKIVISGVLIQALMFAPITAIFWIPKYQINLLILILIIYYISFSLIVPIWFSWMGDLIPNKAIGTYFSKRNQLQSILMLLGIAAGGIILNTATIHHKPYWGFITIFTWALIARIISMRFLSKKYEPTNKSPDHGTQELITMIKNKLQGNFGILMIIMTVTNAVIAFNVTYLAPFWLRNLQMSYIQYMSFIVLAMAIRIICLPNWGNLTDRYGTKKIAILSGTILSIVPFLWMITTTYIGLALISIIGGFAWAGFENATLFHALFDQTEPQNRSQLIAGYGILNGTAIFLGSISGGILLKITAFQTTFLIGGICRALIILAIIKWYKENRQVIPISYPKLLTKSLSFHKKTFPLR